MSKLIIFDCDGVLVDSEFILNKVFSEAISGYGYSISIEECIKRFTGVNEHVCRQLIMKESGIDIPVNYWDLQQSILLKAYQTGLNSLLKPVLEILNILKIPRCVASNSSRNHVIYCLDLTKQLYYFNDKSIFTSQQVPKAKPAPDLFLLAAKEMGFQPENCIVIEDSSSGIEAAMAAGMNVISFLGGNHACHCWYQEKIFDYGIPIAKNCDELLYKLSSLLGTDPTLITSCKIRRTKTCTVSVK